MNTITITSEMTLTYPKLSRASEDMVKNEPMLFSADRDFAMANGGPLTREFLVRVPEAEIIDSRTHMLMKGWFPCIPGWHLDDVPRTRSDGQPQHVNPPYRANHAMAFWGESAPTEFALGTSFFQNLPIGGGVIYERWHKDVEHYVEHGALDVHTLDERRIAYFDWQTFHRGVAAVKDGWRFFIRASWNTHRPIRNEIRKQVQVYLPVENAGW